MDDIEELVNGPLLISPEDEVSSLLNGLSLEDNPAQAMIDSGIDTVSSYFQTAVEQQGYQDINNVILEQTGNAQEFDVYGNNTIDPSDPIAMAAQMVVYQQTASKFGKTGFASFLGIPYLVLIPTVLVAVSGAAYFSESLVYMLYCSVSDTGT